MDRIKTTIDKYLEIENTHLLLDIGTGGTGYIANELGTETKTVGIDISTNAIKNSREFSASTNSNSQFLLGSADYLPFRDSTFDVVTIVAVLEHVLDDQKAVSEISRILSRGGIIFVVVPNNYSKYTLPMAIYNWLNDKKVGHLRHYDIRDLNMIFKKERLQLLEESYSGHTPYIVNVLIKKLIGRRLNYLTNKELNAKHNDGAINLIAVFRKSDISDPGVDS